MSESHDLYCDGTHTPRQRCNDALAPAELRMSPVDVDPVDQPAPIAVPSPFVEEPASALVRDAVVTASGPRPPVYVAREWARTEEAVARMGDDRGSDPEGDRRRGGGLRRAAMVAVAIVIALVTVRGVRGRRGERM